MKNFIYLKKEFFLIGILMLFFVTSKAQIIPIDAYAFHAEPTIDGVIDEPWADNNFLQISHLLSANATISDKDFSGKFKISWYNNNLYFLFVVTDDIFILNEGEPIWLGDNINLYLDLRNEKSTTYDNNDYLCHFKWGNSDYYERYNGNDLVQINNSEYAINFAQTCDTIKHLFIMEIAIRNIAELNGPATLDEYTTIGLDVGIYDYDDENFGMYSDHLSWIDTTGLAWSDPSRLGTAGLGTIVLKSAKTSNPAVRSDKALVKVYPSIVSNSLNIQTTISDYLQVDFINLLGKKVESFVVRPEDSCIDVSALCTGIYYMNVYDSKGLFNSQKIVVSR